MGDFTHIEIGFDDDRNARFRLLWDEAPQTCSAIAKALPHAGEAQHAVCSGPAAVFFFEREVPAMPENATTSPAVGELLYTYYPPNWRRGYPDHTSEVYWFYSAGGRPTVPGLFVPAMASVFALAEGPAEEFEEFCAWSASLHREGFKPVRAVAKTLP
jgi:hypothetical protein